MLAATVIFVDEGAVVIVISCLCRDRLRAH
jgi:hypothetical protein